MTYTPKPPTDDELAKLDHAYSNGILAFLDRNKAAGDVVRLVAEVRRLRSLVLPVGMREQDVRELEQKAEAAKGHPLTVVKKEALTPMDVYALLAMEEAPQLLAELRRLRSLIRRAVTPDNPPVRMAAAVSCPTYEGRCWFCRAAMDSRPPEPHTMRCPWPALLLEGTL